MAKTLMVGNLNSRGYRLSMEDISMPTTTSKNSYFKFYQLKLKKTELENFNQQEHEVKRQLKQRSPRKQSYREYMNSVRQKSQRYLETSSMVKDEDEKTRSSSVMSITNRRTKDCVTFIVKATSTTSIASTSIESKSKTSVKTRKAPVPTKQQCFPEDRTARGKSKRQRSLAQPLLANFETEQCQSGEPNLLRSYSPMYTEAMSSSSFQIEAQDDHQSARQSLLHTLMLHLNDHPPSEQSKWDVYRDFGDKFTASISSSIYRNFERVVL